MRTKKSPCFQLKGQPYTYSTCWLPQYKYLLTLAHILCLHNKMPLSIFKRWIFALWYINIALLLYYCECITLSTLTIYTRVWLRSLHLFFILSFFISLKFSACAINKWTIHFRKVSLNLVTKKNFDWGEFHAYFCDEQFLNGYVCVCDCTPYDSSGSCVVINSPLHCFSFLVNDV